MNSQSRKDLAELVKKVEAIKEHIETARDALADDGHGDDLKTAAGAADDLRSAEEEKFDNMSEGLQQGEKGQAIEAAKDKLQELTDHLEEAAELMDNLFDGLLEKIGEALDIAANVEE